MVCSAEVNNTQAADPRMRNNALNQSDGCM